MWLRAARSRWESPENVSIFYEHVVNQILEQLIGAVEPKRMKITGDLTARGGITIRVSAIFEK